jgi:hypothetical protein
MITKQPDGSRLIVNTLSHFMRRGKFDPWPVHAVAIGSVSTTIDIVNHLVYWYTTATLKDGVEYYYLWDVTGETEPSQLHENFLNFQAPDIGGFHDGESFNYVLRPAIRSKSKLTPG